MTTFAKCLCLAGYYATFIFFLNLALSENGWALVGVICVGLPCCLVPVALFCCVADREVRRRSATPTEPTEAE